MTRRGVPQVRLEPRAPAGRRGGLAGAGPGLPPVVVPGRRAHRPLRPLAVAGAVLLVLLLVAGLGAVLLIQRHPGAPARLRALAAAGAHRLTSGSEAEGGSAGASTRPARLACVPAVAAGAPGELRTLAQLGAAERATVVWEWAGATRGAGAERQAVRAAATARGLTVTPVGARGALAVTGPGDAVRAVGAGARGATAVLAAAGTRSICVLE